MKFEIKSSLVLSSFSLRRSIILRLREVFFSVAVVVVDPAPEKRNDSQIDFHFSSDIKMIGDVK